MAKTQVRGEQILDQSVSLTADIKDTLAIANGGTGAVSASAARTALGAQALISPAAAFVATSEAISSTTYADLTTTTDTVTVTIGASGAALVIISADIGAATGGGSAYMSYAVSGASTVAATDAKSIAYGATVTGGPASGALGNLGASFLETGLTAGSTTFKAKYRHMNVSGQSFANRRIAVIPL